MYKILFLLLISFQTFALTLTIGHVNDTHSHFNPKEIRITVDDENIYTTIGGFPRLYKAVKKQKERIENEGKTYLFFHAGDAFQGQAFFKINEGNMNADLLSRLPIDGMVLGNHEFDLDNKKLSQFINNVTFPIVASNIDYSNDLDLKKMNNIFSYLLYEKINNQMVRVDSIEKIQDKKKTVVLIGIVLEDLNQVASNVGQVKTFNEIQYAKKMVKFLHSEGLYNIIALTHIGLDRDTKLAEEVPEIGVVIGGHSHSLLGNFSALGFNYIADYPLKVEHKNKNITCVVQSGQYSEALGELDVIFNDDGTIKSCSGNNQLLLDNAFYYTSQRHSKDMLITHNREKLLDYLQKNHVLFYKEDFKMRHYINYFYEPELKQSYGMVIAKVPNTIEHVRLPTENNSDEHGSRVAPIIAESFLKWGNSKEVVEQTGMPVDIAFVSAGTIRTNIEATSSYREGNVSLELLPFNNYFSVMKITGKQIVEFLDSVLQQLLIKNVHTGKFPYTAGLRYTYVEQIPYQTGKLREVKVKETNQLGHSVWVNIDLNKTYHIILPFFYADGNDGWDYLYTIQKESTVRKDVFLYDRNVKAVDVFKVIKGSLGYYAQYKKEFDCEQGMIQCNVDALAVIEYIQKYANELKPLNEHLVTFKASQERLLNITK